MINVISFLEKVGQNAQLRGATIKDLELAFECSHTATNPEIKKAVLDRSQSKLETLLCSRNVCCMIEVTSEYE